MVTKTPPKIIKGENWRHYLNEIMYKWRCNWNVYGTIIVVQRLRQENAQNKIKAET